MAKKLEGKKCPKFDALGTSNTDLNNSTFIGKNLVLYFYPKDMTPGCTAQSCNLSENYEKLQKNGFEVLGVSCDSVERHQV